MFAVSCRRLVKRFSHPEGAASTPADDLSFDFEAGAITSIVGESGCGKTTLLRLLAGLEKADAGSIVYTQTQARGCSPKPVISMVFQEPRLFPWLSVKDNVALAVRHLPKAEQQARTAETLAVVGLSGAAAKMPHELSGGMAQRVGMARALCRHPDILLLDEAFSALDALTREKLRSEFIDIAARRPMTTILVTHDVLEAVLLSKTICRLDNGRITQTWRHEAPYPRRIGQKGVAELADTILASFFEARHRSQGGR